MIQKRSVTVKVTPPFSTHSGIIKVSLSAAPWETPDPVPLPPETLPVLQQGAFRIDSEEKILGALKQGYRIFDEVVRAAFGIRHGSVDGFSRKLLHRMADEGKISRRRDPTLTGNPIIWEPKHDHHA